MKGAIGLGTMLNGRNAAISADGIPLHSFTAAGATGVYPWFAFRVLLAGRSAPWNLGWR